jgi:hypothetical protein
VVVAPGSWLGEEFGAQAVLAVDEMEPDSAGGSLTLAKRSCGGSALWCLLTRQLEDGARSEEGSQARGGSSGGAWPGGSSTTSLGEERRGASASRAKQSG